MAQELSDSLLSEEFLSKYVDKRPKNAGVLFDVIYLRTYCRFLTEKNRREHWWETCKRVVDYSLSLFRGLSDPKDLVREAEDMYDAMFNLLMLPAGRTMWIGGTEACRKYAESNFNCGFFVVNSLQKFTELFHMLLCGCGVGFRVLRSDVANIPTLRTGVSLNHKEYTPKEPSERSEFTETSMIFENNQQMVTQIDIGDSKEGWVKALRDYFRELVSGTSSSISINYDSVRPKGERIKAFGGRAAGHGGIKEMFEQIHQIIENCAGGLRPIDCLDICCIIALNVVVGGTRRSSLIGLFDPEDQECMNAKIGLWTDPEMRKYHWRVMSNNSAVYKSKPSRQELEAVFDRVLHNGEPGFFNLEAAKRRRADAEGLNPCAEILLDDRGVCNLSTVVATSHINSAGDGFDDVSLEKAVRLATRAGLRQTNVDLSLPEWDYVQKRDRLTGVSMTGWMDALDRLGWMHDGRDAFWILDLMNFWANDEALTYARKMRIPSPVLVTSIKPEGTISQLPTVSSGLHRSYAPYFIRRVRVSDIDPVCKALRHIGVPNEPDKSKTDRIVFSFPIASGAKISSQSESAVSQYRRYLAFQENYTDHNSSCTLTFAEEEIPELIEEIEKNWHNTIAISLLPKPKGGILPYPQMPYEEISEDKYRELMRTMPEITESFADLVDAFERGERPQDLKTRLEEAEVEADPSCIGACPLR